MPDFSVIVKRRVNVKADVVTYKKSTAWPSTVLPSIGRSRWTAPSYLRPEQSAAVRLRASSADASTQDELYSTGRRSTSEAVLYF